MPTSAPISASSRLSHDSSSSGSKPDSRCQMPRRLRLSEPRSRPKKPAVSCSGSSSGSSSPSSSPHVRIARFCYALTHGRVIPYAFVNGQLRRLVIVAGCALALRRPFRRRRLAALRRRRSRDEQRPRRGRRRPLVGDRARHRRRAGASTSEGASSRRRSTPRTCRSATGARTRSSSPRTRAPSPPSAPSTAACSGSGR